MQKRGNKVRMGIYLDPKEGESFELLRNTLYHVRVSQSVFFQHMFSFFKEKKKIESSKDIAFSKKIKK